MAIIINKFIDDVNPSIIESDAGKEFINSKVQNLFLENNIHHITFDKSI